MVDLGNIKGGDGLEMYNIATGLVDFGGDVACMRMIGYVG